MNQIKTLFDSLRSKHQTALMPFITAGDPDLEFTGELIQALDNAGCHLLELGFPYSDPVADGPVIQESYVRALENGVSVEKIFEMMKRLKPKIKMPIVAMVSYSIIFRIGTKTFFEQAVEAGFAGAIIPDLPLEEMPIVEKEAAKHDFALNPLVTPMTDDQRAIEIARSASGFVYFVSVVGITGERTAFAENLKTKLDNLRANVLDQPICIGFGISQPEHVKQLTSIADGLIVGSAFMKRVASCQTRGRETTLDDITEFAESLLSEL